MATQVPLAPFINDQFYVTSAYPYYPSGSYHGALDLSTGQQGTAPLYSIIDGEVTRKGINTGVSYGNYIEITRSDGIRVLYGHMEDPTTYEVGDTVLQGQQVGIEGDTGHATGYHVHVEMWDSNGDHMNPADFMGIPNEVGGPYIYDGTPVPPTPPTPPVPIRRGKFPWVLYAKKLRDKHILDKMSR